MFSYFSRPSFLMDDEVLAMQTFIIAEFAWIVTRSSKRRESITEHSMVIFV